MMPTLLYLLKANVVLALFAVAYYGLLRQLTFFRLNRAYLVVALLFAAVYPALPVPALLPAVAFEPFVVSSERIGGVGAVPSTATVPVITWQTLGLCVYTFGTGVLLLRLLAQLLSLALVRRNSQPALALGQPVRLLAGIGGPFSFGQTIYLSASTLADTANLPAALRHEQAHVRQWHTVDVLLAQVAVALAWANPAAWLLRRAVLDNLEYLADEAALQTGLDRRAYQYSLLRQQPGGVPAPALAFHFSFLTLKNRITMLNQPASSSRQLGRYLLAAPLLMTLALGYSAARAQTAPAAFASTQQSVPANLVYYLDGQQVDKATTDKVDPSTMMATINVLKPAQQQLVFGNSSDAGAIIITTKANANSPAVVALDERIERVAPRRTEEPVEVNVLVPKALAYITSHYPDARLSGKVMAQKTLSTGAVQYEVQLVNGRRPFNVYFTPQGDFVSK